MNFEYKYLLDGNFHPDSRVWIYQSSRLFTVSEALQIEQMMNEFVRTWVSHGVPVKGAAHLFFGQFIILMADETATGVSGCSTDSSVHLIKQIEKSFGVDMFDRMTFALIVKDKSGEHGIQLLPMTQMQYAIDHGFISSDTLYFNNLVQSKEELEKNWIIPLKDSWVAKRISFAKSVS
jgi:hypothetical protein